jgi:hypothetical protein
MCYLLSLVVSRQRNDDSGWIGPTGVTNPEVSIYIVILKMKEEEEEECQLITINELRRAVKLITLFNYYIKRVVQIHTRTSAIVDKSSDKENLVAHGVHLTGYVVSQRAQLAYVAAVLARLHFLLAPTTCEMNFKKIIRFRICRIKN